MFYPFIEARLHQGQAPATTCCSGPRDVPGRTALGAMAIGFYVVLLISGGNDVIAEKFDISLNAMTWAGRIGLLIVPPLAYYVTYRICLGLQQHDREVLAHGVETGIIRRLPDGRFIEVHQPLAASDDGHGELEYAGWVGAEEDEPARRARARPSGASSSRSRSRSRRRSRRGTPRSRSAPSVRRSAATTADLHPRSARGAHPRGGRHGRFCCCPDPPPCPISGPRLTPGKAGAEKRSHGQETCHYGDVVRTTATVCPSRRQQLPASAPWTRGRCWNHGDARVKPGPAG